MPKYLVEVSYTSEGARGLTAEGGSARRAAVKQSIEQAGGQLEAFYFALGEADAYLIVTHRDNETAAAGAIAVAASGAAKVRTVVLLEPEEIDAAVAQNIAYSPPGA